MRRDILKQIADIVNPYSWIMATRNMLFDIGVIRSREFTVPTICIGNISVGGTGKTPHTEYLVKLLKDKFRTIVLSRGYGRCSKGYIMSDKNSTMKMIGDEPFQIKNKFKEIDVAVCEKRVIGIENIISSIKDAGVILLDDAFQHRYVKAGLNVLLIDTVRPIWNDCILPFGRLRESACGIKRADIVIMTKCEGISVEQCGMFRNYIKRIKDIPVFFSSMKYGELYPLSGTERKRIVNGSNVLLVTGIARPEPLKKEIERQGAIVSLLRYADHHNFNSDDFREISRRYVALKGSNRLIVTTEKDATRIVQNPEVPAIIKENIHVMPIDIEILNEEKEMFNKIILDYVTENSRNR